MERSDNLGLIHLHCEVTLKGFLPSRTLSGFNVFFEFGTQACRIRSNPGLFHLHYVTTLKGSPRDEPFQSLSEKRIDSDQRISKLLA